MTEWDRAHQTTRPCPAILCEAILRPAIERDPPHSRRDAKAEVSLARRLDGRRNPDIPIGRRSLLDLLAVRGESRALHRDERGASRARRDDREYRLYLMEEQRRPRGCIARRMQTDFHHGLLGEIKQVVGVEDGIDAAMPSINPFCSRMLSGPHRRTARPFGKALTAFGGTVKLRPCLAE